MEEVPNLTDTLKNHHTFSHMSEKNRIFEEWNLLFIFQIKWNKIYFIFCLKLGNNVWEKRISSSSFSPESNV